MNTSPVGTKEIIEPQLHKMFFFKGTLISNHAVQNPNALLNIFLHWSPALCEGELVKFNLEGFSEMITNWLMSYFGFKYDVI